jgi:hypothetical protein
MSAAEALKAARAAGIRLGIDGDALTLEAFIAPPPALLELLSRHKGSILALLRSGNDDRSAEGWQALFDERAGFAEFDGCLPRKEAETRAFACCVVEWLNGNPMPSPPGRCHGCGRAGLAHDALLPFGTGEATNHAWLHAGCWPAWRNAREADATAALAAMGIPKPRTQR